MQETQVQSLGREDPLENEVATHSSTLVWEIPWIEEPGGLVGHNTAAKATTMSFETPTLYLTESFQ